MKNMQNITTKVFVYASLTFGVLGVIMVLSGMEPDEKNTGIELVIGKLFQVSVFVILTSFALSVASKYLNSKS
ncbi:MAG TPA: hypothetical protein PK096_00045 [Candidatus Saccharibacteria bacterium]|nr:hypothetical protein [Patescibacteria group bacterium]HRJ05947.1 hypothetical protein [Candidatus Saccharibacteria bacterium]HRK93745.1 hypothetical protein [Candidatus Saccharibacteria bacterium]